ncbi:MAG TPA: DUF3558 family protein [Pseudonocardiaceae bacterium]|nr:DUF3558 family protein [Pseudonocardiaceae bacterium]
MTNTVSIRRSLILPMLLVVGLGIVACSGGETGTAIPSSSSTTPTSAPQSSNNPVAAIDPCTLLSQDDLTNLGLTSTGPEHTAKSRGCGWQKGPTYSLGIYADASQGIDELRDGSSTTAPLQSHDAIKTPSNVDCSIDIAITKSSSVSVSIAMTNGDECGIAMQYATLIEPKLPAQQK